MTKRTTYTAAKVGLDSALAKYDPDDADKRDYLLDAFDHFVRVVIDDVVRAPVTLYGDGPFLRPAEAKSMADAGALVGAVRQGSVIFLHGATGGSVQFIFDRRDDYIKAIQAVERVMSPALIHTAETPQSGVGTTAGTKVVSNAPAAGEVKGKEALDVLKMLAGFVFVAVGEEPTTRDDLIVSYSTEAEARTARATIETWAKAGYPMPAMLTPAGKIETKRAFIDRHGDAVELDEEEEEERKVAQSWPTDCPLPEGVLFRVERVEAGLRYALLLPGDREIRGFDPAALAKDAHKLVTVTIVDPVEVKKATQGAALLDAVQTARLTYTAPADVPDGRAQVQLTFLAHDEERARRALAILTGYCK